MRKVFAVQDCRIRALVMIHEKAILGEMKNQGGVIAAFGDDNGFRVAANAGSRDQRWKFRNCRFPRPRIHTASRLNGQNAEKASCKSSITKSNMDRVHIRER
jgi:hypothetical protein